jgi:hypothetical protein
MDDGGDDDDDDDNDDDDDGDDDMISKWIQFDLFLLFSHGRRDHSINCYKIWIHAPNVHENHIY